MTRDKAHHHHEIGDIVGMRYRISCFLKQLPMPTAIRAEVLRAVHDIHMDFWLYQNKPPLEVWQSYLSKVGNKLEKICLENGMNSQRVNILLNRLKQLRR